MSPRPGGAPSDATLHDAMREAIALATSPDAPVGENPRVGCVILSADGAVVGRGHHRGAGTAHAEVDALADAGEQARGGTAVVTLEPCRHVGRTGPCTLALIDAGVDRVVFAQADPTSAGGGAADLAAAGVVVEAGLLAGPAAEVNEEWTTAVRRGWPVVTWKCAVSLDGRVAGAAGGPTAITSPPARALTHALRARVGAIIVGTGTVLADDPHLTVRDLPGWTGPAPLRVVMGSRPIPPEARVLDDEAPTLVTAERDPMRVLRDLFARGVRHALLEGGPTLAAAFLDAGAVDRVDWFVAPLVLGAGPVALPDRPSSHGVDVGSVDVVGEDVHITGSIDYAEA